MKAEITYNAGKSCQVGGVRFAEGITRTVTDPAIIKRCQETYGFSVHIPKEKAVRPVEEKKVRTEAEPEKPVVKKKAKSE